MNTACRKIRGSLFVLLALTFLSGCATPRETIVLLQDADGGVGSITVAAKGGTRTLNIPNAALEVTGSGERLPDPKGMDPGQIDLLFGSSMKSLPSEPMTFVFYFLHDTTELTARSKSQIPGLLSVIRDRDAKRMFYEISIIGHTDATGDDETNMRLSYARSEMVRDVLLSHGIRSESMELRYHGAWDPAVQTGKNIREPLNRRVEVVVK